MEEEGLGGGASGPLVAQPLSPLFPHLVHLETSEEWRLTVGGLLAPMSLLKEVGSPLVERSLGCEQGRLSQDLGSWMPGNQVATLGKRGRRWCLLETPPSLVALPRGFWVFLKAGRFSKQNCMCGVPGGPEVEMRASWNLSLGRGSGCGGGRVALI